MFTQPSRAAATQGTKFNFPVVPEELAGNIKMSLVDSKPHIDVTGPIKPRQKNILAFFLCSNPVFVSLRGHETGICAAIAIAKALRDERTKLADVRIIGKYLGGKNPIREEGAQAIAEALKYNRTLVKLALDINKIGDEGLCAIAESLRSNTTLTSLDLDCNYIGNDGASAINSLLKENTSLQRIYFGFTHSIDKNLLLEIESRLLNNGKLLKIKPESETISTQSPRFGRNL